ncbi:MAG TPA: hypothetical protein VE422_07660 [Terriglobia bacterium]|nr:hypothetical protein [Terriglobia bacterium]
MGLGDGFPDFGIDGFPNRSQPWMVRTVRKLSASSDDYFASAAQVLVHAEPIINFAILRHTASTLSQVLHASILCDALVQQRIFRFNNAFSAVGLKVATDCHLKLQ